MSEQIPEWERKIDESRDNHKHTVPKEGGGFELLVKYNMKYCWECDQYFIPNDSTTT